MDKGSHPKVVRTWLADKIQKQVLRARTLLPATRKLQPHNKT